MGETAAHQRLKRLGASLLFEDGCRAVAVEVRCPIARYRVDVAGYLDPLPSSRRAGSWLQHAGRLINAAEGRARTLFLECKQSRADYLRDTRELGDLLDRRERLVRERHRLEDERIKQEEPHLRKSSSFLFKDMEAWEFHRSDNGLYQEIVRQLDALDKRIHGQTKFARIARYRLADALYVVAPTGMLDPREISPGWGLIECAGEQLQDEARPEASIEIKITKRAPVFTPANDRKDRVLRNIAVAASRDALKLRTAVAGG